MGWGEEEGLLSFPLLPVDHCGLKVSIYGLPQIQAPTLPIKDLLEIRETLVPTIYIEFRTRRGGWSVTITCLTLLCGIITLAASYIDVIF